MNKERKYAPITDLLSAIVDNRGKTVPTADAGFPLIATNCVKHSSIYPTFESIRYVSENTLKKWFRAHLQPNDLLFVNKGTPGRVCAVPNPVTFCAAQDMIGFRCDPKKVYYKYLLAALRSPEIQRKIANFHVGLVIPHFKKQDLDNILIPLFDHDEQVAIGDLYFVLSEKIELNNRINAELEAMAKTIYDYWFVQFDFPADASAKVGKKSIAGKPYKSSGGKMVWNKELKREIPEGWEVKSLNDCIELIIDYRGKTPKKLASQWSENMNDIIALSAKHVKNGKLVNLENANRVSEELYQIWMKDKLSEGDILLTSEAPCGEFFYLVGKIKYCLSQRLFAIRSNKSIVHHSYLYFELSKGNGISQILGKVSGSTVFGIRQDELKTVNILVPHLKIQNLFAEFTSTIFREIRTNEYQIEQLGSLRDWLLPMLINGQVKVK